MKQYFKAKSTNVCVNESTVLHFIQILFEKKTNKFLIFYYFSLLFLLSQEMFDQLMDVITVPWTLQHLFTKFITVNSIHTFSNSVSSSCKPHLNCQFNESRRHFCTSITLDCFCSRKNDSGNPHRATLIGFRWKEEEKKSWGKFFLVETFYFYWSSHFAELVVLSVINIIGNHKFSFGFFYSFFDWDQKEYFVKWK